MRGLKQIIFTCTGIFLLVVGSLIAAGLNGHVAHSDLIVVPGNTVDTDRTPSPRLRARLDMALQLFREGRAPIIFVSGGIGEEGFDEAISMSNYLLAKGVPSNSIVIDSLGIDTAATAKNAAGYMRANHLKSALVVTQYFHVPRTKLALERQGVYVSGTAHARYVELRDIYSAVRETVAYVVYSARL